MKGISKLAKIVTKIVEVCHWVGAGLMAATVVCCVAAPRYIGHFVDLDVKEGCSAELLDVYGFQVSVPVTNGSLDMTTFVLFGIGAAIILALMAVIFHNLNLVFKKSENATPFQKDNIRRMKEIGIFSIAVPLIGFVMSILIRLVTGVESAEISLNLGGIVMGIVVLCLTGYFIHGAELEEDINGLL